MCADQLRKYRFEKEQHWNKCLFAEADRDPLRAKGAIGPFAPYTRLGRLYASNGAHAPLVTGAGETLWFDDDLVMHRLSRCNDDHETCVGSPAIASSARVIVTPSGLWVINSGPPERVEKEPCPPKLVEPYKKESFARVELYEEESFARLLAVDLSEGKLIDIAGDSNGVWALVKNKAGVRALAIDRSGQVGKAVDLAGISDPKAFVYLPVSKRFVVLTGSVHQRLLWFTAKGGVAIFSRAVAAMHPCFTADVLSSGPRDKVFLAGKDAEGFGGRQYILIFDADGNRLEDLPLEPSDSPVTGIAATRDSLFVAGPRGLLKFDLVDVVPMDVSQLRCVVITPVLFSPDREDLRRWLRVEASANLPEGSTLEITYASTDVAAERDRLNLIALDESIPSSRRIEFLLSEPDFWRGRTVFQGVPNEVSREKSFAAKLFDVSDRYLWICISLTAAAGARIPLLSKLDVIYPGRTLMENLPSIYQKEETQPDSFLRGLVGVLETTTQGLDASIGSMGSRINPSTADATWLDFVARWLGVPWDDGLSVAQKQAVLGNAADLTKNRGTRAGLERLLECLIPGTQRRFRVTDATADYGFAIVGGPSCGSTLPAMLGGRTRWSTELDSTTVLGYMRLGCEGQLDDGVWQIAGKIRIEVAATAAERKAWEPWLLTLITQIVPATVRIKLKWVTERSLRSNRLDGTMIIEPMPVPHLGTDAVAGFARLPEQGTRLSDGDPIIGTRLR